MTKISDWGYKFISEFWKHLISQLSIESKLLIFFYLKINKLTE